jgi:hypothetical protein
VTRIDQLEPEFVEFIPDELEPGRLYISITYGTAQHLCCCGCGNEVVTPLLPVRWSLVYDGETVSLYPSVGNWSLPCQSHYFVRHNKVIWSRGWPLHEIEAARRLDRHPAAVHFDEELVAITDASAESGERVGPLQRVFRRWRR